MTRIITTIATTLLIATGAASAQSTRDATEQYRDYRQLRRPKVERQDVFRDLARLEALAGRFDAARSSKNQTVFHAVREEIRIAALAELAEGSAELARSRPQAAGSDGGASFTRREMQLSSVTGGPAEDQLPPERQDLRDTRRDLRDEQRNVARKAAKQKRRQEIAAAIRDLDGATDEASFDRERGMLGELIKIARAETAQNQKETNAARR